MSSDGHAAQLAEVRLKLQNYFDGNYELPEDDDEETRRNGRPISESRREQKYFRGILRDVCNVIRNAMDSNVDELGDLILQADKVIYRGVERAHSKAEEEPYLDSFAHSDANPQVLVLKTTTIASLMGYGGLQGFIPIMLAMARPGQDNSAMTDALKPPPPWAESPKPHLGMSRLSRFKPDVMVSVDASTPVANFIYQARCEITEDSTCRPTHARISSGGACLAVAGAGGWKERSPVLQYHLLNSPSSDFPKRYTINPGLKEPSGEMIIDEERKLIFVADSDRIKSFTWGAPGGLDYARALPTHTVDSSSWEGPLVVLPGGRLIRAGQGSAGVWNLDSLQTHGPSGKEKIGGSYARDEDDDIFDDDMNLEDSDGSAATGSIEFQDKTLAPYAWTPHPIAAGSTICGFNWNSSVAYSCFVLDLEHGGRTATRYLGHGGTVIEFSTSAADPNVFVTGCTDGHARLFDVRLPLPVMTFTRGGRSEECAAAVLAHPDGVPTLFTGGTKVEEVRLWDIRAKETVYELSTGNTAVVDLAWDANHNALYAATESNYMNRMGGWSGYRRAKIPKDQREVYSDDDMDDEDQGAYDCDSGDESSDGRCWPEQAYHGEDHFGYLYDAGEHKIFRYAFKESPDITFLPPYGQANSGSSYW